MQVAEVWEDEKTEPILAAALEYARRAPVFPVGRDKQPLTEHGFKDATRDPNQILAWWDEWPDANVALAIPEDIVVVDVDPRNGGDLSQIEGLPKTRMSKTPSGGWHLYFKIDPEVKLRGQMGPGIDLKQGGRGYVLLPPSVIADGEYKWATSSTAPIAAMPEQYVGALAKRPKADAEVVPLTGVFSFQKGTPYGESALEREVGRVVTAREGERNETLNSAAFSIGQLVAGGELKEQPAVEQLAVAAERSGLEPDEIEGTLRSGFDAGFSEPRSAPDKTSDLDLALDTGDEPFWMDWTVEEAPAEFLFYPILAAQSYTLVFGSTEAAKSIFMQWLAAHLSREGRRVSYYSMENPAKVDRERMRRLKPDPRNFRITQQPLNLAEPDQVRAMVERDTGQDLIVLDTYSHVFGFGSDDENAKAVAFARVIRYVMYHTGSAVVVIDHTGFENRYEPRGASAKRQQVDVAIFMEKREQWVKGKPAPFAMENRKSSRFANPFSLTGAVLDTEDGGLDVAINERWMLQEPPP